MPDQNSTTGATTAVGTRTAEIYLTGSATNESHVVVTDQSGHHIGDLNGKLVDQIHGAHVVVLASEQDWKDKLQPILDVPADKAYTITLDGRALSAPDTEGIGIIGPSSSVAVRGISMHPGDKDTLTVDPNATALTYRSTRAESPTIEASVSDARADYAFVITGVSDKPGNTINLHIPAEGGNLIITNAGSTGVSNVNLQMTRSTEQGVETFKHSAIALAAGDTADMEFGNWTNPAESIPLVIRHQGQQTTRTLTDQ